jgi:dipeptidyl aminopeptidase/acylaminoacyl peptidase
MLTAGSKLGPYDIVAKLGAGGMGEVWRARDPRIGRDVAIKVLPPAFAGDPDRLRRFEQEAKATGALNHPNVLAVFDVGSHDGAPYLVSELLEGETLRERLAGGAIPVRRAVELAEQIAQGLAAAHEKAIVHRDLKPENLFVTRDGRVKILDFGLAKLGLPAEAAAGVTLTPSRAAHTEPGLVLGSAGYMAPEQVRGLPADHRADIFAFGTILYEMLSGRRAFARDTGAETMTAILRDEPPELAAFGTPIPPPLDRIARHCLEKSPDERFQSARDLAFALHASLEGSGAGETRATATDRAARRAPTRLVLPLAALGLALALGAGYLFGRRAGIGSEASHEPTFTRLTFGHGTIRSARFAPDGKTIVYGAAWDGQPIRAFLTRTDGQDSTALSLPDAEVLAVSSTGELALSLNHAFAGWMGAGTLARAPLLGGGARPVLEAVREADWTPDGSDLAVVRRVNGRERIELPIGRVLYETSGWISHIRVSPKGDRIAFADHPIFADDFGSVAVVDLAGKVTKLTSSFPTLRGLAWSPGGDEILFTALRPGSNQKLYAVDLNGRQRFLLGGVTHMLLLDVARDGRLLLGNETHLRSVEALTSGSAAPRDVSLAREGSVARDISPDGSVLVVTDQNGENYATFLRRADGSPPVRLGEGDGYGLSPDGKWVLALTPESRPRLLLHPTGAGQTRELPNPEEIVADTARWLPGSGRIVVFGRIATGPMRGYLLDLDGAPPRPFTEPGANASLLDEIPASPDGTRVVAQDPHGVSTIYRTDGGAPEPIRGLDAAAVPIEFCDDGRSLFVAHRDDVAWRIMKLDLASGRSTPWTEIRPAETAGLRLSRFYITPNGRFWIHSYSRLLTDLYTVEGLR